MEYDDLSDYEQEVIVKVTPTDGVYDDLEEIVGYKSVSCGSQEGKYILRNDLDEQMHGSRSSSPLDDLGDPVRAVDRAHRNALVDDLDELLVDELISEFTSMAAVESPVVLLDPTPCDLDDPLIPPTPKLKTPCNTGCESSENTPVVAAPLSRAAVLSRVCGLLEAVAACERRGETPELLLPTKTKWHHLRLCDQEGVLVVSGDPAAVQAIRGGNSAGKFNLIILLLNRIKHLLETNTYSTKRDLFYQNVSLFGSQRALDTLLDDVTRLLCIPRHLSHVRATSKGLVAGDLVLRDGDVDIDCSAAKHGVLVPSTPESVEVASSNARFIMVIEKDATFQKLLDCSIHQKLPPGIFITGKGFPDLNTRVLLRRLVGALRVPAVALVDADPHGLEIFFVYKFGSLNQIHDSGRLTCPELQLLGVRPTEIEQLHIPKHALVAMTASDLAKARCLLSRPYVQRNSDYQRQIRVLQTCSYKAEIQSLTGLGATFLTDVYLPQKLAALLAFQHT